MATLVRFVTVALSFASALYTAYVTQSLVHTHKVGINGATYTTLSVSSVEFYNAGGFEPIDGVQTSLYSFEWFVFATDHLRQVSAVIIMALLPLDRIANVIFVPFLAVGLLVEAAKLAYFLTILFGLFGQSCVDYAFCRNRNPAVSPQPDSRYIISLIACGVYILYYGLLIAIARFLRIRRNRFQAYTKMNSVSLK